MLLLSLLYALPCAASTIQLEPGQFVVKEAGWGQVEVRGLVLPDPVGIEGSCVVVIGEEFDGTLRTEPSRCDDGLAESAALAAASWQVSAGLRDFVDQRAAFRAVFIFHENSVGLRLDERWLVSERSRLPERIETFKLVLLEQEVPSYPKKLRGSGQAAICMVEVEVGVRGKPTDITASGCPAAFQASARAALRKWKWEPPLINGEPTPATTTLKLTFRAQ